MNFLEFERPVAELEGKIEELRHLQDGEDLNIEEEIAKLQTKVDKQLKHTYARLTPWQKTQVARHPDRPHFNDYVSALIEDFEPLAGDRCFGEDAAIVGGPGRFRGRAVMIIGLERGHDTASRLAHNFGMARPEGYRKARRLMAMADRFNMPILTLVDTAGAYPGVDAEARGQAEAIARCIETCVDVTVPLVSLVIGEGGSGGAIAIALGNRILMMEHAVYSVISPEGCASILWRSGDQAQQAAEALKLTAQDLLGLGVIDAVVPEPLGAAHRTPEDAIARAGAYLDQALGELRHADRETLKAERRAKLLAMGRLTDA